MRLDFYSHACVKIEDAGKSVICDPWLVGDTYWGAWRLYPSASIQPEDISCDYIAISHWHFDHLNLPTLRRIDKTIPILVPKFPITWMVHTLKKLGFSNVIELDHGKPFAISGGVSLVMYQCQYQDDCVIVFRGPNGDVINLNDAKPLRSLKRRIRSECNNILATLRSYSYAWSYPSRFIFSSGDILPIDDQYYIRKFYSDSLFFSPKVLVGFASGICHPLPGYGSENSHLVSFDQVEKFPEEANLPNPQMLVWGKSGVGIHYTNPNWTLLGESESQISCAPLSMCKAPGRFAGNMETTIRKMTDFFSRTRFLCKAKAFRFRVGFFGSDGAFVIGYDSRTGIILSGDCLFDVEYHIAVEILHDAFSKNIFTNIDISKLWSVRINGELNKHFIFTSLFSLFEHGYFRKRNILNRRFVIQWFYRRDELVGYIKILLRAVFSRKSFAEIFAGND